MTTVHDTYQSLMQAYDEARNQGHPTGAYDDPKYRHLGWYDHTTRTAHVISMTVLRGEDLIPPQIRTAEGREGMFGGKRVPVEALEVKEVMPSFIQVTEAPGVLFLSEIMVSVTDTEGHVQVQNYRLIPGD